MENYTDDPTDLTDGVQQCLLDTLEAHSIEQQFDCLQVLAVDGKMEGAATHVVDTIDVQRHFVFLLQRLSDDRYVAHGGGIQVDALLVGQLHVNNIFTAASRALIVTVGPREVRPIGVALVGRQPVLLVVTYRRAGDKSFRMKLNKVSIYCVTGRDFNLGRFHDFLLASSR
jgi:hypothetical protein